MTTVVNYFQDQAKKGIWGGLYDKSNPASYPFILRVEKCISLLDDVDGKRILDLGCGTGILLPHVIENGGEYIGLDISDNMLEKLKDSYLKDPDKNVEIILGDIQDVELPINIDYAVGLGFIEYFPIPEKIADKIYSSLNRDGCLILSFPNFNSLDYFVLRLFTPLRYLARKLTGKQTVQPPRKLWNSSSAIKLFEDSGFKKIKVINYHINVLPYPFPRIAPRLVNAVGKKVEGSILSKYSFFATSFIVVGEK